MLPTLRALFDAPNTSPLAEVKVTNVADLLVELTDVRHPMAAKQTLSVSHVVKVRRRPPPFFVAGLISK